MFGDAVAFNHDCHASRLAVLHGASCCNVVTEISAIVLLLTPPNCSLCCRSDWSICTPASGACFHCCANGCRCSKSAPSALHCSGTLPFPVPDTFYELPKRQDDDMRCCLAPVSQSGNVAFSSTIHAVLRKKFPAGSDMVQAGLPLPCMDALLARAFHGLCSMQICYTYCGQ